MKALVYCGPCGAGKTFQIEQARYGKDVPILDMNVLRKRVSEIQGNANLNSYEAYTERMHMLTGDLLSLATANTKLVIIEGIFAPNSHSRKWLTEIFADYKIDYEFIHVDFNILDPPLRIIRDFRVDNDEARFLSRLELFVKYAKKF